MKHKLPSYQLAGILLVPLFLTCTACADDISNSVSAKLEAYEIQLAGLESRLENASLAAGRGCQAGGYCSEACCEPNTSSSVFATVELLMLKYYRGDGMRYDDGDNDSATSSYKGSPRIAIGYITPGGLGIRARYWTYDQTFMADNVSNGSGVSVDAYTIDLELFETIDFDANWSLEVSGGVRYNEFTESLLDTGPSPDHPHLNSISAWGGTLGLELRRDLSSNLAIFGRARGAILTGDKLQIEDTGDDIILRNCLVGATEIALGLEYRRCLSGNAMVFMRGGYEWQNWSNYSAGFEDSDSSDDLSGPAGVGFNGLAFQFGFER